MMKKYLLSILMAFCMVLCLAPMAAFADDVPTTINIDVGGGNTDASPDYKIDDEKISLLKRDVTYVLTGETDKKISVWGSNFPNEIAQTFYIVANNVTVNGGIVVENSPVKMVLDVPENTVNTISSVTANDLTIRGTGTLNASYIGVTQNTSYMPSALHITDTKVVVNCPANRSGEWNGVCVLDGNADVTYTACGDYAPLKIGVKSGDTTHKVTMMDNAKLRCLHADPETPSASSVSGLEIYNGDFTMGGNSYLEVQGRPTTGKFAGYGLISYANVSVTDKAAIKATGYDVALCVDGNLAISGGNVEAKSAYSNGIFAGGELKISDGAKVNASGYYPALFGNGSVSIESGSQVEATSTADAGIFSRGDVSIKNSTVKVSEAENYYAVTANGTTRVTGSWVETNYEDSIGGSITDSVLFNGNSGTVIGNATLLGNTTLEEGKTLVIPEGASLSVGAGNTFTNNGTVTVEGGFSTGGGILVCNHHSGGTATCKAQAVCDVCRTSYGDLNPNHTALQHVAAKAATTEAEGNIEYWYCADCGKYYSDAAAAKEITRAQTVTAKLMPESTATPTPAPTAAPTTAPTAEPKPTVQPAAAPAQTAAATATPKPTTAPTAAPTPTATPQVTATIPQTGDTGSVTLLLALLLLSGGACLGMAVSKKVKQ